LNFDKGIVAVVIKELYDFLQFFKDLYPKNKSLQQQPTRVFAIAGLDGRAIGSKSLFSFSSGRSMNILPNTFTLAAIF
jgi:hypothetical protein